MSEEDRTPDPLKQARGAMAHHAGLSAEGAVADHYLALGYERIAERWRGKAGEIDLIFQRDGVIVFVEVKRSASHASAAELLRPAQMQRLARAAEEYIGLLPDGLLTEMRIDVALVDGTGVIEVLENALM